MVAILATHTNDGISARTVQSTGRTTADTSWSAQPAGTLTDMPLEEYRRKRDFGQTPEPAPDAATAASGQTGRFVVQRHRATRLHYDFRLEIDGVLVSWAVPKGPTLDSKIRRMAVHVEDHPIEYFDFEGVIPARQYGSGDVIVWDWGTWEPEAPTLDGRESVENGELKFRLHGERLKGRFTIVRTSRRPGSAPRTAFEDDQGEQWLLIHKRDEHAQAGWDAEDHPQSVKTGRTNDEVKANRDAIWVSEAPAASAGIDLSAAKEAALPTHIEPMLAALASKPFSDPDWLFEIKWDGYRVQAVVDGGKVRIWTRNLNDAETYFPRLLSPPTRWIEADQAVVDGEVVALDEDGRPDFSLLQTKLGDKQATGLCTRRSTCSTSTAGRCSTCRSKIASACSAACSRSIRGSGSRPISMAMARPSTRPPRRWGSKASSPSCADRSTSRADGPTPGSS
jgi:DNA ligase D-like protein (predicted 3'-phosphoesterase)